MGLMLLRRRMMGESGQPPEWDYQWDASKGLLQNNGFNYTVVGAAGYACSIVDDYMQYRGSSSNYKEHTYPRNFTSGVLEAEVLIKSNARVDLRFGNGTYGIGIRLQYSTSYKGIFLGTGVSTQLGSADFDKKYKIRLVLYGQTADVYIDDVLKANGVDVTTYTTCASPYVSGRGSGSGNVYSRLYSLKMKFNRTE